MLSTLPIDVKEIIERDVNQSLNLLIANAFSQISKMIFSEDKITYDNMYTTAGLIEDLQEYIKQSGYRFSMNSVKYIHRVSDWIYQTYERYYASKFQYWMIIQRFNIVLDDIDMCDLNALRLLKLK